MNIIVLFKQIFSYRKKADSRKVYSLPFLIDLLKLNLLNVHSTAPTNTSLILICQSFQWPFNLSLKATLSIKHVLLIYLTQTCNEALWSEVLNLGISAVSEVVLDAHSIAAFSVVLVDSDLYRTEYRRIRIRIYELQKYIVVWHEIVNSIYGFQTLHPFFYLLYRDNESLKRHLMLTLSQPLDLCGVSVSTVNGM